MNDEYHRLRNTERHISLYRFRIPDDVREFLAGSCDEVKHKDDEHHQRTDHSPHGLPEEVGLVADHELDVFVEPAQGGETGQSRGCFLAQLTRALMPAHSG